MGFEFPQKLFLEACKTKILGGNPIKTWVVIIEFCCPTNRSKLLQKKTNKVCKKLCLLEGRFIKF